MKLLLHGFIVHNVLWPSLPQTDNILWEKWFNSLLNMTPSGFTCSSLVPIHENFIFLFFPSCSWFCRFLPYSSLLSTFFNHSPLFLGKQSPKSELSYCHTENLNKHVFLNAASPFCNGARGQTSLQRSRGRHIMDIMKFSALFFAVFLLISKIQGGGC